MPDKPSLIDDASFDSIGRDRGEKGRPGSGSNAVKVIVAIVLLLAAGLAIAYSLGLLEWPTRKVTPSARTPPPSDEEKERIHKEQMERIEDAQRRGIPVGSLHPSPPSPRRV